VHGIPGLEIELASKRTWPIVNVYLTIGRLTLYPFKWWQPYLHTGLDSFIKKFLCVELRRWKYLLNNTFYVVFVELPIELFSCTDMHVVEKSGTVLHCRMATPSAMDCCPCGVQRCQNQLMPVVWQGENTPIIYVCVWALPIAQRFSTFWDSRTTW